MIEVRVHDPRRDPEPAGWSDLVGREHLSITWTYELIAIAARSADELPVVAELRVDGALVGLAAGVLIGWSKARIGVVDVRLFGTPSPAWYVVPTIEAPVRRALHRCFERALGRLLGPGVRGVVYRGLRPEDAACARTRLSRIAESVPDNALELDFADRDGWLATLTPKRRNELRRQTRHIEADQDLVVEFTFGQAAVDPVEFAPLIAEHRADRAGRSSRPWNLGADYFAAAFAQPGNGLLTYRSRAGRLIAVTTLSANGPTLELLWWAQRRPEDGGRKHVYYHSYVRIVDYALEHGYTEIRAGRGLEEVKRTLGFRPVPLQTVAVVRLH
jgi:hypothetical protein